MTPRRRTVLAAWGVVLAGGLAGCTGNGGEDAPDGYPPAEDLPDDPPPAPDVDRAALQTADVEGTTVPLVPIDAAHAWYQRADARFVDARGAGQYERGHVAGAVHSPAPDGGSEDPVANWPTGDRVVTYCGCPHHLSTLRAGSLIDDGYEAVFAIDEGFGPWVDRGYPVRGEAVEDDVQSYDVVGRTDPADAGAMAWAVHAPSDQREAAPIADDGSFALTLHFGSLPAAAPITVRTPSYEVTRSLARVTADPVTG
jgi:rhodanese-related sulfurtransferase